MVVVELKENIDLNQRQLILILKKMKEELMEGIDLNHQQLTLEELMESNDSNQQQLTLV